MWIDSHCHLDAPEFDADRAQVAARARAAGVGLLVLPAVQAEQFEALRALAHEVGAAYALGIHPLAVGRADEADLERLGQALARWRDDPRLVAVGEIGLDRFVPDRAHDRGAARAHEPQPESNRDPDRDSACDRARQRHFYLAQLGLARAAGLPVILHLRRAVDEVLAGLRRLPVAGGIAHAFNGSRAQADAFVALGLRLGFGGAMTFERALRIRALAQTLPETVPVLETDAPDIPPQWLYRSARERAAAPQAGQQRNEPAELPRIGVTLAALRGWSLEHTAAVTSANARAALPRLAALA